MRGIWIPPKPKISSEIPYEKGKAESQLRDFSIPNNAKHIFKSICHFTE